MYENTKIVGYQSARIKPSNQRKQSAAALYSRTNSDISDLDLHNNPLFKNSLSLLLLILSLAGQFYFDNTTISIAIQFAFLIGMLFIFSEELFRLVRYVKEIAAKIDSPSRLIICGKGLSGIVQYQTKLFKSRITTVLGRRLDVDS